MSTDQRVKDQRFNDQAFIVIRGIGPSRLRVFLVLGTVVLVLLGWGLSSSGVPGSELASPIR
ncbi:MAG: hypothetical protein ACKOGN_07300 [Gammaproteobacteria bacterium]